MFSGLVPVFRFQSPSGGKYRSNALEIRAAIALSWLFTRQPDFATVNFESSKLFAQSVSIDSVSASHVGIRSLRHFVQSLAENFRPNSFVACLVENGANIRQQCHTSPLCFGVVLAGQLGECGSAAGGPVPSGDFRDNEKRTPVIRQPIERTRRQLRIASLQMRGVVGTEAGQFPANSFSRPVLGVEPLAHFARLGLFQSNHNAPVVKCTG